MVPHWRREGKTGSVREASAEATLKLGLEGGVKIFQTKKGGRTGQEVGTTWAKASRWDFTDKSKKQHAVLSWRLPP